MVSRHRVDAGLDIGQVLPEQLGHVGEQTPTVRHRLVGVRLRPRAAAAAPLHLLAHPPHDLALPDIPGHARELACAIGEAGGYTGNGARHFSLCSLSNAAGYMGTRAGWVQPAAAAAPALQ